MQCQAANSLHLCSTLSPIKTMRQRRLAQQGSQDDHPQEADELPVVLEDQELPSGFCGAHCITVLQALHGKVPVPTYYAIIAYNAMLRIKLGGHGYFVSSLVMMLET